MRRGLILGLLLSLAGGLGAQSPPDPAAVEAMARNAVQDFFDDASLRDYGSLAVLPLEGEASMALAEQFADLLSQAGQGVIGPADVERALVDLNLPPRQLPISQDLTDLFNRLGNDAFFMVQGVRTPDPGWHGTIQLYDPAAGGYPWIVDVSVEIQRGSQGARRSLLQEHPEYAVYVIISVLLLSFVLRWLFGKRE
jgi:hypothetical protein